MSTTVLRNLRSVHHSAFAAADLVDAKDGRTLSVCLPARNEAATIGPIVETIRAELVDGVPLVDEILVINDHSSDDTAAVARGAGARVLDASAILPTYGEGYGKGEVLWKSVYAAEGDLIVWCDADIRQFGPRFVTGIAGPLITDPEIGFAKGFYTRPAGGEAGGGRVTELVARPLLSMLLPHLAGVTQPLSGEYGGRRDVLEQLRFVEGYGVDVALLIDVVALLGAEAVVQVDLDVRLHRNRPLDELSPQATAVAQTIIRRALPDVIGPTVELIRPGHDALEIEVRERPPLIDLDEYLARTA
jgi:glucosyl-3-phosphoglycerate synthase